MTDHTSSTPETDAFICRIDDTEICIEQVRAQCQDWERERAELRERLDSERAANDFDAMAEAFCRWPLPDSVCADLCATMPGEPHRSGTNLLTVSEAKQALQFIFENVKGHPRREEAEVDQTPSTASDDPPCSLLLKFLFLRMSVEKEILEYSKLSDEEKVLAAQSMFDGRYWPNIVVEEARKSGHPFSDYVVKHVAKIAGGEMSNHNHDQQ